ncbi:MAG: hypothetical protein M0033_11725 [Nitrospiraceae bacterium]|nr:hypothetical protein [Nitrospiraceae bacterium]MDA8326870.1 hypothetical protein [Nitrospiraceae bacterium]
MPKKKRALPQPPGRRGFAAGEGPKKEGLMFDELQEAMAGGQKSLEEFMKKNIPEGEYSRRLTEMMMGMSGIPVAKGKGGEAAPEGTESPETAQMKVPEDILHAAHEGDVQTLKNLLARQQGKSEVSKGPEGPEESEDKQSLMEKEIMDSLYEISVDNGISMDWIIQRALKLYIRKYRDTGQL